MGAVEIAKAPNPGKSCSIDASYISARVEMAGIDPGLVQWSGAKAVRATTLHLEVTSDMVEEDLRRYIETRMPWNPGDTTINMDIPMSTIVIPDGDVAFD